MFDDDSTYQDVDDAKKKDEKFSVDGSERTCYFGNARENKETCDNEIDKADVKEPYECNGHKSKNDGKEDCPHTPGL